MKRLLLVLLVVLGLPLCADAQASDVKKKKTVYMSYILHGNMNYDRYVRTKLWDDFPVIYNNLLDFMDEHPDFKGQLQFSGQTLGSLQQAAPHVLEHAMTIHKRGQLNFTGTFYSEPVNGQPTLLTSSSRRRPTRQWRIFAVLSPLMLL